jgi:hypothetical protein
MRVEKDRAIVQYIKSSERILCATSEAVEIKSLCDLEVLDRYSPKDLDPDFELSHVDYLINNDECILSLVLQMDNEFSLLLYNPSEKTETVLLEGIHGAVKLFKVIITNVLYYCLCQNLVFSAILTSRDQLIFYCHDINGNDVHVQLKFMLTSASKYLRKSTCYSHFNAVLFNVEFTLAFCISTNANAI